MPQNNKHNREKLVEMLKGIIGNFKSIIGQAKLEILHNQ